jgi:lactoylglutathione lyase
MVRTSVGALLLARQATEVCVNSRDDPVAPMKFIYTGIHVSDLDRSIDFYTKELRMKLLFRSRIKETGGEVAWLKSKGSSQVLELNWYPKGYPHGGRSGLDHLAFQVEDADKAFGELTRRSRAEIRPFEEGRWRLGYVSDPDGNWVEIGSRKRGKRRRQVRADGFTHRVNSRGPRTHGV